MPICDFRRVSYEECGCRDCREMIQLLKEKEVEHIHIKESNLDIKNKQLVVTSELKINLPEELFIEDSNETIFDEFLYEQLIQNNK